MMARPEWGRSHGEHFVRGSRGVTFPDRLLLGGQFLGELEE
jgi:hypothetical protein